MSDVFSDAGVGVAARYAAQIRELLAFHSANVAAQRAAADVRTTRERVTLKAVGPQGASVDFQV